MSGYDVLLKSRLEDVNLEDHALCVGHRGIVHQENAYACEHCGLFTCQRCAEKGQFLCCLGMVLESAAVEGERIVAASLG